MILQGNISVGVTSGFSAVTNNTTLLHCPINKFNKQIALAVQMQLAKFTVPQFERKYDCL